MVTNKILIKNTEIIDPGKDKNFTGDLLVDNGKIVGTGPLGSFDEEAKGAQIVDATGMITAPGFIDTHSHFRDPGFTYKEDIFSGAKAAAAGGYTGIIMMANTDPAIDSVKVLKEVLDKGKETPIEIMSAANVTKHMDGRIPVDMKALRQAGAMVFTDDGKPIMDESLIEKVMKKAAELKVIISFHEEDPAYVKTAGINNGKASQAFGIEGADRKAEYTMVKRDIRIAEETGASILIQHISAKESVELVRQGKKRGVKVYAEAAPHHFSLTEEDLIAAKGTAEETMYKMNPPLRTEEDRQAIIRGLADGTIDMIATDHAPHSSEEKNRRPFKNAPSGITGLETALSLGIMHLVDPGYLSMERLMELMSLKPAQVYGIKGGSLEKGNEANLVIFDPEVEYTFNRHHSKGDNSPWRGRDLKGSVIMTIAGGKVAFSRL